MYFQARTGCEACASDSGEDIHGKPSSLQQDTVIFDVDMYGVLLMVDVAIYVTNDNPCR